ncbi:hypothetical protein EVAR_81320_1 [Eumeta japonica]|uniref:Uncharacterized protein n=1 Tax=Eumeta variegata TaxID=151549 RepID=A0A4C1W2V7_EUMVA|nr:hypothetical protein EVAR_81320_1 [Eumeta japonica]
MNVALKPESIECGPDYGRYQVLGLDCQDCRTPSARRWSRTSRSCNRCSAKMARGAQPLTYAGCRTQMSAEAFFSR